MSSDDFPIPGSLRGAPSGPMSKEEQAVWFRRAWLDLGIAVIKPTDILDDFHRQAVTNAANMIYGKRA